jgi:hypothetical protein
MDEVKSSGEHCSMATETVQEDITKVCKNAAHFVIIKNTRYGNSALEPLRVFSNADPAEGILVRLDDKLSRIKYASSNDKPLRKNDIGDMLGYLILYCVKQGWTDFDDLID